MERLRSELLLRLWYWSLVRWINRPGGFYASSRSISTATIRQPARGRSLLQLLYCITISGNCSGQSFCLLYAPTKREGFTACDVFLWFSAVLAHDYCFYLNVCTDSTFFSLLLTYLFNASLNSSTGLRTSTLLSWYCALESSSCLSFSPLLPSSLVKIIILIVVRLLLMSSLLLSKVLLYQTKKGDLMNNLFVVLFLFTFCFFSRPR